MKTVYILGAGASRFAGFPTSQELLPFLKRELTQRVDLMTRESGNQWRSAVDQVITFLTGHTPVSHQLDIELIATLIDLVTARNGVLGSLDLRGFDLPVVRCGFARLITSAFQQHSLAIRNNIFEEVEKRLGLYRDHVRKVIDAWAARLVPGDTIITFNWDLLHEMILSDFNKWNYHDGYGFHDPGVTVPRSQTLILKLHGSCNWAPRNSQDPKPFVQYAAQFFPSLSGLDLDESGLPLGVGADHGEALILPSYLKSPADHTVLLHIWARAAQALRDAAKVTVLGYSLPPADGPTRTMVSLALQDNKYLDAVEVVVGGDDEAHKRWIDFCNVSGKHTKCFAQTFEEFVLSPVCTQ